MAQIMTTREIAKYLKLHEITIGKYAAEGKIPAIRIGRVWRFDKEIIDEWISGNSKNLQMDKNLRAKATPKVGRRTMGKKATKR